MTLDCWKRHFPEKNYIENYFYSLKTTKIFKLLLKNVEELLFGWVFLDAHTARTLSKHDWVRRLKSYNHLTRTNDELTALAILNVYLDIHTTLEDVLRKFIALVSHRLGFDI